MCILCRKKQELLSKTGQWMNKGMAAGDHAIMRRIEADLQLGPPGIGGDLETPTAGDKRPKLERAHSAAEKENVLQRSGSALRRQFSQQEYRGELEHLYKHDSFSSEQSSSVDVAPKKHKRGVAVPPTPSQQQSFSSSDDELRSTPECTSCEEHDSEKGEPL